MAKAAEFGIDLSALPPEQRRRYDLLLAGLDLLDQAIAVFDAGPHLVTWNKAMLRLLDFPESMMRVGTPFEAFARFNAERGEYGEGDVDQLVAARMAAARAFQPHYIERMRPNGRILAVRGVPIPNLGFVSLWTDITEQRRAEAQVHEQNLRLEARVRERTADLERANAEIDEIARQLRLSESRLRLTLDAIPAMIAHLDARQRYRYANRAYAEWFGRSKEDIVGRSAAEVAGAEIYTVIAPYLQEVEQGERVSYEYAHRDADGRFRHARSAVVPDVSEEGGYHGCFVMAIDITEQKASQAALVQAQKMEAVGQLTGGLAHDFNNLLTIIIGNLSALQSRLGASDNEYLTPSLQAARRGAELINRLLGLARRQALAPTAVEVGSLVQNMSHLLARTLGETIAIRLRLPGTALHAMVDAHQLENALLNLAINARDAMPEGGELIISVRARHVGGALARRAEVAPGDYVQIDVSDTGKGIEPALIGRVFEPFFTTKPFAGGSGLGLAMVYGFVRQSGGNIRILSTPGSGTSVRFVLPIALAPQAQAASTASTFARGSGELVLLVEDEAEVRKVIRMQLTELGHPVIEAANGKEALELLAAVEDIGVLLSDTVMPGGVDGRELARQARVLRPTLPILLVTGYALDGHGKGANDRPEVPVLRKPFDSAALARALDLILKNRPDPSPNPDPNADSDSEIQ